MIIENSGFESGLANWQVFNGTANLTSEAFAGANSLSLASSRAGIDQGFSVVAGETYTLSGYGKTTETAWSGFGVTFYDDQWTVLDKTSTRIIGDTWSEYSFDALAPEGSSRGILWAWKGGDTGTTELDELTVSGTTPTPPPPPPTNGELLSNPNFELNLTAWNTFTGSETTTADTFEGTAAIQLSENGSGISQAVSIIGGETYQLSGYGKYDGNLRSGLGIDFWTASWTKIEGYSTSINSTDWQLYTITQEAPASAAHATIWSWKGGTSGSTILDALSLQVVDTPPANQAPSINNNGGSSSASVTFEENNTGAIANIDATDADGESEGNGLTYSLEGPDISQISIDPNTGALSFNTAPDLTDPTDSNGDNQYEVDVIVTDSAGESDRQSLNITIIENSAIVQFTSDLFEVSENTGAARITVARTGNLGGSSLVNYEVEGGFALEGDDYTSVSGQLSFATGESQKSILVPITNDEGAEGDETFSIRVFDPNNASLGPLNTSIIKIVDDDGTLSSESLNILTASGLEAQRIAPTASIDGPTGLKIGPSGEVFVVEKTGQVERIVNGVKQSTPFLDITDEVYSVGISQGLAGFALDPNFATNGYIYALYTTSSPTGIRYGRLSRFTVSAADPTRIDPNSQKILIGETPETGFPDGGDIHLVGDLRFGNDGTLLASYGDAAGNGFTDTRTLNSQNLDNLGGAIVRVDPETGEGLSSNPFYTGNTSDNRSRIWAYGLRNPYRFEVGDDGSTNPTDGNPGTLYIGDVQRTRNEEINVARGGENFGWPYFEGNDVYQPGNPGIDATAPTVSFSRGESRSVIGGAIYQGDRYPERYQGRYFEADYSYGVIRSWRLDENDDPVDQTTIATGAQGITDLEYDPVTERIYFTTLVQSGSFPGQLYAIDIGPGGFLDDTEQVSVGSDGTVWKIDLNDRLEQRTENDWGTLPGALASVSIASESNVWGVNAGGNIYQWDGGSWTFINRTGIDVAVDEVSVGEDGAVWALGTNDSIWQWNGSNSWFRLPGALENVSVVTANNVWGNNASGLVWQWNGASWTQISTADIPTPVSEIDAGADGTIIALGTDDTIWQRDGDGWTQLPGRLEQVSVGNAGNIWGVNQQDEIYQYNGQQWTRVSSVDETVIPI